jgi:hypothetical protein
MGYLIPRYEWLVQNAGDRDSAGILNNILLQTRHHLVMFEHALKMGGTMGPGISGEEAMDQAWGGETARHQGSKGHGGGLPQVHPESQP